MTIEATAKVNLTLEVLGERSDGYHALRSVVLPVSLSDTLEIASTADGSIASDSGYPDDLCIRAAHVLRTAVGGTRGADIRIAKRIPAGGGLGGGSADAAAALIALNGLWGCGLDRVRLAELGAAVGSDVPALVLGHGTGPVLMEGRGEIVRPLLLGRVLWLVLVNPGVFSSTREVYSNCTPHLSNRPEIVYNMCQALADGDVRRAAALLMNDLQPPAEALHPEITRALADLTAAGTEGVLMSGSGSTVFGLVPTEAWGREIAALLEAKGYWARCVHSVCPVV